MKKKHDYFLVSGDILTEAMRKTIEVKELLLSQKFNSINAAVKYAGFSRSAYYRYKDKIHKTTKTPDRIVCIFLLLEDKTNTLAGIINEIGKANANILTINQEIPIGGTARVSIYIETNNMTKSIDVLLSYLIKKRGVLKAGLSEGEN